MHYALNSCKQLLYQLGLPHKYCVLNLNVKFKTVTLLSNMSQDW